MNILGNNANKLNDIIFQNRNKNYGAYAIRSSYDDSLKKSLLYMMSIVALLFGSVIINNKLNAISENENPAIFEDPAIEPLTYSTPVDLTPPKQPEPQHNMNAAAPSGAIGTVINDDAVESASVNIDNPISGTGTETATGTSPTGTETSSITSIHIESPPATVPTEVVVVADEMPEFEGGTTGLMRYIAQNIVYPPVAREIGQEGTVYVSFVVSEVGTVEGVKVMRGIGYGCDEEVVRVVSKMPKWKKVGKNAGHAVKVRYNIPVSFKLK
ncbi:MAG: energy transducer TonB [Bacteroidetes bacterium]|nr:energy transducer TonB [Bacteroidota bacterium]